MYIPASFHERDPEKVLLLVERHPFATLITPGPEQLFVSHVPLVVRRRDDGLFLAGHLARANAHWQALGGVRASTAIFHGPHAYISPTWYATSPAVPTWNYVVVHASGPIELQDDEARAAAIVRELTERYEGRGPGAWSSEALPADFRRNLLGAIVAFEMRVEQLEGKVKLSQNRSPDDRRGAIAHLRQDPSDVTRELAAMMELALT